MGMNMTEKILAKHAGIVPKVLQKQNREKSVLLSCISNGSDGQPPAVMHHRRTGGSNAGRTDTDRNRTASIICCPCEDPKKGRETAEPDGGQDWVIFSL